MARTRIRSSSISSNITLGNVVITGTIVNSSNVAFTAGGGSGGGGAGETQNGTFTGGAGGSGVVIIAYPDSYAALSTISAGLTYDQPFTRAGYRVYRFTAGTGTITF